MSIIGFIWKSMDEGLSRAKDDGDGRIGCCVSHSMKNEPAGAGTRCRLLALYIQAVTPFDA
jgi:hypothetical protein